MVFPMRMLQRRCDGLRDLGQALSRSSTHLDTSKSYRLWCRETALIAGGGFTPPPKSANDGAPPARRAGRERIEQGNSGQ